MTARRLTRLVALGAWSATLASGLAGLAIQALHPVPFIENTFGFGPSTMVAFVPLGIAWSTVGAMLIVRRPGNSVGPCMLVVGFGFGCSVLGPAITFQALAAGDVDLARWAGWGTVLASSGTSLSYYLAYTFPTGRGHTAAWHRIGLASLAFTLVFVACLVTKRGPLHLWPSLENPFPFGPDLRPWLGDDPVRALLGLSVIVGPIILAAVLTRYRAAGPIERLQLRWVLSAMVLAGAALIAAAAASTGEATIEGPLTVYALTGLTVPLAIGVAILRYRLYDIDRIVGRTIGWAVVTGILVVVFASIVIALQTALAGLTQGETLAIAVSTLTAAALVQPLRRRVQGAVDRRFDRARYDAQRTVEAFSDEVRQDLDLTTIRTALLATAGGAVRPSEAGLWLRSKAPHGPTADGAS
jgi:hypothetical protein